MRQWERVTSRSGLDAVPAGELARYGELHGVDDLASDPIACVETASTPTKRRRFGAGRDPERTIIAVTRAYLMWFTTTGGPGAIGSARLEEISDVHEYQSDVIEDSGVEVLGFRLGGTERESWFLPLDAGREGAEFRAQLRQAIEAAKA